jgi:hypothetical protein
VRIIFISIVLLLSGLVFTIETHGQQGFSITAGANYSQFKLDDYELKGDINPPGGIEYHKAFNEQLFMKFGLRYSYRTSSSDSLELRNHYLDIYLNPVMKLNKTFMVEAGFQFNNILDQQFTRLLPNNPIYHIPFEKSGKGDNFDVQGEVFVGVGARLSNTIDLTIRYTLPFGWMDHSNLYAGLSFKLKNPMKVQAGKYTNLEDAIANRKIVTELVLQRAGLENLPTEVWQMRSMNYLFLNGNKLTSLPAGLGLLTKLERLFVANNELSYLPPEIGRLKALEELDLSYNELSELPDEIGQLSGLRFLKLNNNNLTELPATIMGLQSLVELDVSNNTGLLRLPQSINLLGNLETLIVDESTVFPIPFSPSNPRLEIIVK